MEKIKEEKEEKKGYNAVNVPTQYAIGIQDSEGEVMNVEQTLADIENKLDRLLKSVG